MHKTNLQAGEPVSSLVTSLGLPQNQKVTVSIVICTRHRSADLRKCLRAISDLQHPPDEVIVVDNSPGDKNTEDLAREFSAEYVVEPAVGLSKARNRGLVASASQIVAYLDDDAIPDRRWLEYICEPFSDAKVAVVTGEVAITEARLKGFRPAPSRFLDKKVQKWFEIAAFGGLGIGTNMALRKSACRVPNMFDERLGRGAPYRGMEEHHAFATLLSQNYCAVHVPAAVVYHCSQSPVDMSREARNNFAYSLLLFSEFPSHRFDLLRFLFRRMRRKPLSWERDSPDPGGVISSNWWVLFKAGLSGAYLYMRTRKLRK